jgi:pyruvate kinase
MFYSDVMCFNACRTAEEIHARGIIGITRSGYSAFKLSSFRPKSSIFMFSDNANMLTTMNLIWGVQCFYYDRFTSTDETVQDCTDILKESGFVATGDVVINTGAMPLQKRSSTNMLKVTEVE